MLSARSSVAGPSLETSSPSSVGGTAHAAIDGRVTRRGRAATSSWATRTSPGSTSSVCSCTSTPAERNAAATTRESRPPLRLKNDLPREDPGRNRPGHIPQGLGRLVETLVAEGVASSIRDQGTEGVQPTFDPPAPFVHDLRGSRHRVDAFERRVVSHEPATRRERAPPDEVGHGAGPCEQAGSCRTIRQHPNRVESAARIADQTRARR